MQKQKRLENLVNERALSLSYQNPLPENGDWVEVPLWEFEEEVGTDEHGVPDFGLFARISPETTVEEVDLPF